MIRLSQLNKLDQAVIKVVDELITTDNKIDLVTQRLHLLGFRSGERIQILAKGLFGGEPILVQIKTSRFALRKTEADRIQVEINNK